MVPWVCVYQNEELGLDKHENFRAGGKHDGVRSRRAFTMWVLFQASARMSKKLTRARYGAGAVVNLSSVRHG